MKKISIAIPLARIFHRVSTAAPSRREPCILPTGIKRRMTCEDFWRKARKRVPRLAALRAGSANDELRQKDRKATLFYPGLEYRHAHFRSLVTKPYTIFLLGLLLLFFVGCSSAPEGTIAIKELQNTIEQRIGQEVVAVGAVDTNVGGMSMTGLFRLYRGNDSVWSSMLEGEPAPPQGVRVRVTGVVKEETFPGGVGRIVYIQAKSIRME